MLATPLTRSRLLAFAVSACLTVLAQAQRGPSASDAGRLRPLTLRQNRYRTRLGEPAPIAATEETTRFMLESKDLSAITANDDGGRFVVGVNDRGEEALIAASGGTPPGEYAVTISAIGKDGEERRATLDIVVARAEAVPVSAAKPPVVLIDGWQIGSFSSCPISTTSADTFGLLRDFLLQDGVPAVYFFDNCAQCPNCLIEELGKTLAKYLDQIRFDNGTLVPQVDLVAHSMGGLIARSYLAGLQGDGGLNPPSNTRIRKMVFVATPHFGSFQTPNYLGPQTSEMLLGSPFLWELATWNQGRDDLRNVDALAVIGNAGSEGASTEVSDGIVSLTSASLSFAAPDERTRVVPYCHSDAAFFAKLGSLFGLGTNCTAAPGIANVTDAFQSTGRIVRSFLADSSDWKNIGLPPSQNPYLTRFSGVFFGMFDTNDIAYPDVSAAWYGNINLTRGPGSYFFSEWLPVGSTALFASEQGGTYSESYSPPEGSFHAVRMKFGPVINAVQPSAGPTYYAKSASSSTQSSAIAAGSLISIYGHDFTTVTAQATSTPLPVSLSGVIVTINGLAVPLLFVGPQQINAYIPQGFSGAARLQVSNANGQDFSNLLLISAAPAVFTLDGSGIGSAAAIHALTGLRVTPSDPAAAGEYISVFLTGLGATIQSGGTNYTATPTSILLGNGSAPISFAGLAPGFVGLYQVNFQVPVTAQRGPAVSLIAAAGQSFSSPQVSIAIR